MLVYIVNGIRNGETTNRQKKERIGRRIDSMLLYLVRRLVALKQLISQWVKRFFDSNDIRIKVSVTWPWDPFEALAMYEFSSSELVAPNNLDYGSTRFSHNNFVQKPIIERYQPIIEHLHKPREKATS